MLKKILFLVGILSGPALAFTPQYYIQSTSSLQSGATFYVSSGTIYGPLSVGNTNYITPGTSLLVNANNVPGNSTQAACIQIGGYNTRTDSCFTQDVSTAAEVALVLVNNSGASPNTGDAFGEYEETNSATNSPFHTYGAYFYASFGNYFNIGLHSSAGEASGNTAENRAGDFDASGENGSNIAKGVYSLAQGAGTSYGGYFVSQATTDAIGIYVQGSTDAIQIGGGDLQTNGSVGTTGQILTSAGPFLQPYWTSGIRGTTTNDNAATGYVGQYVSSVTANTIPASGSGSWQTLLTVSLSSGDWDASGVWFCQIGSGGTLNTFQGALNSGGNAGNTGDTQVALGIPASGMPVSSNVPNARFSLASTTSIQLQVFPQYGSGTPNCLARLSARRIR